MRTLIPRKKDSIALGTAPPGHRGQGTQQRKGSRPSGSAPRAQAREREHAAVLPVTQQPQASRSLAPPGTRALASRTRTSPWARRLMFRGRAPAMATQDSSRLHSQRPLSSAREHSALLVHLGGGGGFSPGPCQPHPQAPGAGLRPLESWALTVPRGRTSRSRGPESCRTVRRSGSSDSPARGTGKPEGNRTVSGTTAATRACLSGPGCSWGHRLDPTFLSEL